MSPADPPATVKFFREAGGGHYDARYFQGTVDPEITREILLKLLRDFGELCRKREVVPILMHGALIGWYWCRRLLPWDNDLDLCVRYEDLLKLDAAADREDLYDRRYYLLEVNPNHIRRETLNHHGRDWREPNKIDARFIHVPTGLFIDLTALFSSGEGLLSTKCPHHYREADLFPLQETEVDGIPVYVPHRVDRVLEQEYGSRTITEPFYQGWRFNALQRCWEPGEPI